MQIPLYDNKNPKSIEDYAKKLIGKTFLEVLNEDHVPSDRIEEQIEYGNKKRKGGLGNLLEEEYFGYHVNSESAPDFPEAGVELKATPYELTKKGDYRAGERLVLTMISYDGPIENDLLKSHLWNKCRLILLVYYWRNRALENNLLYPIHYVSLFTPSETDLAIIKNDYRIIANKVISGKAEELSEADTFYLGACTKGATAEKSIVKQFYSPHSLAKKRAFCYKTSYMTFVLNEYIIKTDETYEHLINNAAELKGQSFADFIISKINRYKGFSDKQLCKLFDREYNNNKAQWTDLAYRMLGIRSNRAEEFRKANLTVKVIRLEENGKMRESMSFPPFRYKELVNETWEDSTLHNYFDETKFLFVVFKREGECYILNGCQLWNMPYNDLNETVMNGWQKIVNTIKEGVELEIHNTGNQVIVENNFPKKNDNRIIHIRPHAQKRYYRFIDGTVIGNGKESDANPLPNPEGVWMPHYSFWINNDYILSQLDSKLK